MEPEVTGMEALITELTPMITGVFGWVSTVCETIVSEPLLLMTTGFLIVGGAVGIFGRLLSRG